MSEESTRDRLPFEPGKRKKSAKKAAAQATEQNQPSRPTGKTEATSSPSRSPIAKEDRAIPEVVSNRMIRRMATLCGIPSALGMATFVVSYWITVNEIFELPNTAVVLVSLGFFGLGVLGLSYGVLSASWDPEVSGSLVGWSEFTINLGRMTQAWRTAKEKRQQN
jgi:Photosynthesis affected mutant 68